MLHRQSFADRLITWIACAPSTSCLLCRDGRRPEHQSVGAGKVAHLNVTQRSTSKQEVEVKTSHRVMVLQQGGCHRQHDCMRLPKCQRDLLHLWPASAPWAFAILVVGTSPDSKAPHRRPHQDAGELHVALVCRPPALQLGKRCAFVGSEGAPTLQR